MKERRGVVDCVCYVCYVSTVKRKGNRQGKQRKIKGKREGKEGNEMGKIEGKKREK